MIFENCIIPDENRLGPIGDGFVQSMKILDGGRISIAALSLGVAKELTIHHYYILKNVNNLENQ